MAEGDVNAWEGGGEKHEEKVSITTVTEAATYKVSLVTGEDAEVISYVGRLTATNFKYEKYAIVGNPIGARGVTSTTLQQPTPPETGLKKFDTPPPPDPFKKR